MIYIYNVRNLAAWCVRARACVPEPDLGGYFISSPFMGVILDKQYISRSTYRIRIEWDSLFAPMMSVEPPLGAIFTSFPKVVTADAWEVSATLIVRVAANGVTLPRFTFIVIILTNHCDNLGT